MKLEMSGLAESIPHRGVFVVKPCKRELLEMIEGRLCLELYMAKAVIKNATKDDILNMRRACQDAEIAKPASELFYEEGLHGYFARVARNNFLEHLYQRVMALLNVLYIHGLRSCDDENWIREYRQTHHDEEIRIVDAIAVGDLAKLEEAITFHVNNFRDFILITLEKWHPKGLNWNSQEDTGAHLAN